MRHLPTALFAILLGLGGCAELGPVDDAPAFLIEFENVGVKTIYIKSNNGRGMTLPVHTAV